MSTKIQTHKGNLLDVEEGILIQGCNALGIMGGGVALSLRQQFPGAYLAYREVYVNKGLKLGDIIPFEALDPTQDLFKPEKKALYIINAITQERIGTDRRQVDYDAVRTCFIKTAEFARKVGLQDVHFPLIGCGLAGGDWKVVAPIIEETLDGLNAHLWTL